MNATQDLPPHQPGELRVTHYGSAAWAMTDGKKTLLFDPYFTRLRYAGKRFGTLPAPSAVGDSRHAYEFDEVPVSDTATIDANIDKADFIFLSHSHFNHVMDVPYIAQKTGATVLGTESTANIARAHGVPEERILTVRGGEDYAFDDFSLKVVPSLHSALSEKLYYESGVVPRDVQVPMRLCDYVEGRTLAYFIRWGEHRILWFGSMNFIEREVQGLDPTVVFIASSRPRLQIHDYTGRLLRAVGRPPLVVATHWDIQTFPYGASQDLALEQSQSFVDEVHAAAPGTDVVVPRHFETVCIGADGKRIA